MSVCGVFLSLFVSCCSPDAESRLLLVPVGLFGLVVVDRLLWVVAVGPSLLGCSGFGGCGSVAMAMGWSFLVGCYRSVGVHFGMVLVAWPLLLGFCGCCGASAPLSV